MAFKIFEATRPQMHNFNLSELIQKAQQEYIRLYPSVGSYELQKIQKYDIFGRPILEIGSLDQLSVAQQKQQYEQDKASWVFKTVWEEIGFDNFQELVTIMGNPDHLKPCDGSWHQCSLFCEDFGHCPYEIKKVPEKPKAEEVAVPRSTESKKRSKKKRRKK